MECSSKREEGNFRAGEGRYGLFEEKHTLRRENNKVSACKRYQAPSAALLQMRSEKMSSFIHLLPFREWYRGFKAECPDGNLQKV